MDGNNGLGICAQAPKLDDDGDAKRDIERKLCAAVGSFHLGIRLRHTRLKVSSSLARQPINASIGASIGFIEARRFQKRQWQRLYSLSFKLDDRDGSTVNRAQISSGCASIWDPFGPKRKNSALLIDAMRRFPIAQFRISYMVDIHLGRYCVNCYTRYNEDRTGCRN